MKRFLTLLPLVLIAFGCSGGEGDSGDVAAANKAAAAAPKSPDQLPASMTPEQRSTAEAGIRSNQAMAEQMNKQGAAMRAAQAGAH